MHAPSDPTPPGEPELGGSALPHGKPQEVLGRLAGILGRVALGSSNLLLACAERLLFPGFQPRTPARIGVLRVGMVGDLAATWPALEALRRRFPEAELVLFTSSGPRAAPGGLELYLSLIHI